MQDFSWDAVINSFLFSFFVASILWQIYKDQTKDVVFGFIVVLITLSLTASISMYFVSPLIRLYLLALVLLTNISVLIISMIKTFLNKESYKVDTAVSIDPLMSPNVKPSVRSYLIPLICISILGFSWLISDAEIFIPDIQNILSKDYQIEVGQADRLMKYDTEIDFDIQLSEVEGMSFRIAERDFKKLEQDHIYSVKYLPYSEYVIDILDENSKSLLK